MKQHILKDVIFNFKLILYTYFPRTKKKISKNLIDTPECLKKLDQRLYEG